MRVKVIAIPCNLNASKLLKKLIVLNMITEKHLLRELSSDFFFLEKVTMTKLIMPSVEMTVINLPRIL